MAIRRARVKTTLIKGRLGLVPTRRACGKTMLLSAWLALEFVLPTHAVLLWLGVILSAVCAAPIGVRLCMVSLAKAMCYGNTKYIYIYIYVAVQSWYYLSIKY